MQVVLLRGPLDAVAPARWLRDLLRAYQGARGDARAATLSSGSHAMQFTAPDAVARATRELRIPRLHCASPPPPRPHSAV
jgi:pimeloyl-ACP methyl ester carboxylesterase